MTEKEAQTIYGCLEANQVVSPIHFCEDIVKHVSLRKAAFQRLEEMLATEGSMNPYEHMLLHPEEEQPPDPFLTTDFYKMEPRKPSVPNIQNMEEWSVLSTEMHYTDPPQGHQSLMVMNCETDLLKEWDKSGKAPKVPEIDLPETPVIQDYLDQFDHISNVLVTSGKFQDNRDVSTTYLGPEQISKTDHFVPEVKFPISATSHTWAQLIGGPMMNILLDTGASKSYMSRAYFEKNKALHSLPRLKSSIKSLRVGDGNEVGALFVIPIIIKICGHKFEIYTLVSEIQPSIDLVLGMKNMHELEGEHSSRHSEFRFLNRAVPLFPMETFSL
ncbi:MAG: retropepsin-like domain-containing protein, partial [Proteobacteria bacterium]|nr:retropepsin-like domain-containing protein [Pseudomonadota bacterium]